MVLGLQQQVHLAQDDHERVVDLVRDAARQLADRGQPLGPHHVGVRAAQVLELQARLGVQARVVEGQADLVGARLEQRDLLVAEAILGLPAERERAQDAVARADRHAQEAADAVGGHRGPRGGQEIVRAPGLVHAPHAPGGGHAADEALADGQHLVDLAEAIREAALTAQQEHLAVGGDEVKARDLVTGDVREGAERLLDDLVEIERAAHRLGHRAKDLQVTDQRRRAA